MNVSDFDYQLPEELIAQYPLPERAASRLLNVTQPLQDLHVSNVVDLFEAGDLLVLNDTKVIPARLYGKKDSGGRIEILLERVLDDNHMLVQIGSSKSPKTGQQLLIDGGSDAPLTVLGRQGMFFSLQTSQVGSLFAWLQKVGHIPLPPYIKRDDNADDKQRYQNVFAQHEGAVAAPTAGLHYDDALLAQLKEKGVNIQSVTLHVGAGTYQPVRADKVEDHTMHAETFEVNEDVCEAVIQTKAAGKRVIAVGTTVMRSLESAARATDGLIAPFSGDTDIFIYPGFTFKVVDALQTNFHLPKSTLMMLVSAFAGQEAVMQAYQHAIANKYRFFSYGDSMLLHHSK